MLTFCCCSYYYTLYGYIIIYTLLYIDEKQKQAEGKEEREPGQRMPPNSSPVPRLSSAPSDVYTVHTIASHSPPHPLATSHRVREGMPPRPVQGDAIATTSQPIDQQPATRRAAPRAVCHPARLVLFPVLFPSIRW